MPHVETPADLAEWLADQIGVWGGDERSPWVADVTERIRRSVANDCETGRMNVTVETALISRVEHLQECHDALAELCQIKAYKDDMGKDAFYRERQPIVWARANAALNAMVKLHTSSEDR